MKGKVSDKHSRTKILKVIRENAPRIFSLGSEISIFMLISLYQFIQWLKTLLYFVFDVDGCLIRGGLEVGNEKMTVEEYFEHHSETVKYFQSLILFFLKLGLKFGICTGRSAEFVMRVINLLFPKGTVEFMICENGADVRFYDANTDTWVRKIPKYLQKKDVKFYNKHKKAMLKICLRHTQLVEPGKEVAISVNPEEGMTIETLFTLIKADLDAYFGCDANEVISITHSGSAVDITYRLCNKASALKEVLKGKLAAYFGDAFNDAKAMVECGINLLPKNCSDKILAIASKVHYCMVSNFSELDGITDLLNRLKLILEKETEIEVDVDRNPNEEIYLI